MVKPFRCHFLVCFFIQKQKISVFLISQTLVLNKKNEYAKFSEEFPESSPIDPRAPVGNRHRHVCGKASQASAVPKFNQGRPQTRKIHNLSISQSTQSNPFFVTQKS